MFKEYKSWKPVYDSYTDDIASEFYNVVFSKAKTVKRISAYFSAKALARYAEGLECFKCNGGHYQLIISSEIAKEDYDEIVKGYTIRDNLINDMLDKLDESLNLEEEKNLSNLAYLISQGVVDIKIAFTHRGIFHDKFGLFYDELGDCIYMHGSNNETEAAIVQNYESFDITCSWMTSEFDLMKIHRQENSFTDFWDNNRPGLYIIDIPEALKSNLLKFNKYNKLICDKYLLLKNTLMFDISDDVILVKSYIDDLNFFIGTPQYKVYLKKYVLCIEGESFLLKYSQSVKIKEAFEKFREIAAKFEYSVIMSEKLEKFLLENELYIDKRYRLGASIKKHDKALISKFESFKKTIDEELERSLRQQQMWDAFYMYSMKKSSNFSVPGSGKTSSVLAVYAFLDKHGIADRVVMIGPKNSFVSWIEEFNNCFGNKKSARILNIQSSQYKDLQNKKNALTYYLGTENLILINYEMIDKLETEIIEVVKKNTLLVFDEVHKIKKIDGVYASSAMNIAKKANYLITLTGTPIPNSYQDIYNNLHLLFPNDYDSFFGFKKNDLKKPNAELIQSINKKMYPFFCRTTKEQLNVPAVNSDVIDIQSANEIEMTLFDYLKKRCKNNKLEFIIRVLQLESDPQLLLESSNIDDSIGEMFGLENRFNPTVEIENRYIMDLYTDNYVSTKMKHTLNLIQQLVSQNKKVILWCIFTGTIRKFSDRLSSLNISNTVIYGDVSDVERNENLASFKRGNVDVLITNPHTLAESVSLHNVCHDAIYYEYSYNLVHLLQSKDRIHRLGLSNGQYTQFYFMGLRYSGVSLDRNIYDRLKEKERNMLDSIDKNKLENVYATTDDISFILKNII